MENSNVNIPLDKYEKMKLEIENLKFQNSVLSKLVQAKTVTRVKKENSATRLMFMLVLITCVALLVNYL